MADYERIDQEYEAEIDRLKAEVERLRAGLREILNHPTLKMQPTDGFSMAEIYGLGKAVEIAQRCLAGKGGLEWQTGKPPKDGWYWLKTKGGHLNISYLGPLCREDDVDMSGYFVEWSGPIPEPAGKGE